MVGREQQVMLGHEQQHLSRRVTAVALHLGVHAADPQVVAGPQGLVAGRQGRHDGAVALEPVAHEAELLGREPVGPVEPLLGCDIRKACQAMDPRRQVFGLAHDETGAGSGTQIGRGPDVVGVVMRDDEPLDGLAAEQAREHAVP